MPGEETQLGSPLMLEGGAVVGSSDLENKRTVGKRDREGEGNAIQATDIHCLLWLAQMHSCARPLIPGCGTANSHQGK